MNSTLYSIGSEYYLSARVLNLLRKLDEQYGINFSISPAALKVHDAYPGGLEKHTRNVLKFVNIILETSLHQRQCCYVLSYYVSLQTSSLLS